MIEKYTNIIKQPRLKILDILDQFTLDQLNTIPVGFNNNIIWNLGHMVATQQGICYKRAGLSTPVSETFFETYKPDTKPDGPANQQQFDEIKELMISTLEQFEKDYNANLFGNYPTWTTRYGVEITSIDDAIAFLPFHEGLHVGYIMAMRKLV